MVADGSITAAEYMEKLDGFVSRRTNAVKQQGNQTQLYGKFNEAAVNYKAPAFSVFPHGSPKCRYRNLLSVPEAPHPQSVVRHFPWQVSWCRSYSAKEIYKNIAGLKNYDKAAAFAEEILKSGSYKNIAKSRYVNDKQITDHYAVIPTGQGMGALAGLHTTAQQICNVWSGLILKYLEQSFCNSARL